MLLSIALIIFLSLSLAKLFSFIKLPSIIGMLISGIILGPFVLNLIDPTILEVSADLRQIALIVILVRAGLSLDLSDLRKVGRPAFLLSFIPATIEMVAITLLAPLFFQITYIEAAILGAVVAAVSPAVVVPRMIKLMQSGHGKEKRIPHLVLASASIDDVFVIIIFMSLIQTYQSDNFSMFSILSIPIAIILGVSIGILTGYTLTKYFKKFHIRDTVKVLIIFAVSFLLVTLDDAIRDIVPFSGLIGVISMGMTILFLYELLAKRLVLKFEKIWVISEIMLFVLVGAALELSVLRDVGLYGILLILIALGFRLCGVFIALIKTRLTWKEKLFVGFSYMPKATVQAAIGTIPLALGMPSGHLILSIAVLAIVITAPIGSILIDNSSSKLLLKTN